MITIDELVERTIKTSSGISQKKISEGVYEWHKKGRDSVEKYPRMINYRCTELYHQAVINWYMQTNEDQEKAYYKAIGLDV